MKIILDIPDETIAMFVNFVRDEKPDLVMQVAQIPKSELFSGSEIKIIKAKKIIQNE